MTDSLRFIPASALSLESFAELFTRSFENYFYPITMTGATLATKIRTEQIDLHHSVVLILDDKPIGQATLGLRGDKAWCGGFGIVPEQRGKGFATALLDEFLKRASEAGARRLTLEVLEKNTTAQHLYTKAGLQRQRDLRLLQWKRGGNHKQEDVLEPLVMQAANMPEIISNFHRLHPVSSAWQRDLPSLLLQTNLLHITCTKGSGLQGYALFKVKDDIVRLHDFGASQVEVAKELLSSLQNCYKEIYSINEPTDSPITVAYDECNFREYDRQYELGMTLLSG
jgi:RimJ/RimL family protein N-acetyltransferase